MRASCAWRRLSARDTPARVARVAGTRALEHLVGQARRCEAGLVLLGGDEAEREPVVPARTQAIAHPTGTPQCQAGLRNVDALLLATLRDECLREHAQRAIEPAAGVEQIGVAWAGAARLQVVEVAARQADRLAHRGHAAGRVAAAALDFRASLQALDRNALRHCSTLLHGLVRKAFGQPMVGHV